VIYLGWVLGSFVCAGLLTILIPELTGRDKAAKWILSILLWPLVLTYFLGLGVGAALRRLGLAEVSR
jgi:hypothetical protein